MGNEHPTEAGTIAELGVKAAGTSTILETPAPGYHVVAVPKGQTLEHVDLEPLLPVPRRKHGTYNPATLAAFEAFVANHANAEHTTIWVDQTSSKITAILNDHAGEGAGPAWGDHRAILQLLPTEEWKHWAGNDGKYLSQQVFAEHIQDGVREILVPDSSTMLEIAQTMDGKANVTWKSATRLRDGEVQFAYVEEVEASSPVAGRAGVPQKMELAIAPFYGEDAAAIDARIRYRVREGKLAIGYQLERPHEVVLAVLEGIASRLGEKHPQVYMGTAPR